MDREPHETFSPFSAWFESVSALGQLLVDQTDRTANLSQNPQPERNPLPEMVIAITAIERAQKELAQLVRSEQTPSEHNM